MIRRFTIPLLLLATSLHGLAKLGVEEITDGFERPLWVGSPQGCTDKLWVMEQAGKVWIVDLDSGKRRATPFLDIEKQVSRKANEEGLLGLAFASDFEKTGRYYVNFTDKSRFTRIVRFTAEDREQTKPESAEVLLKIKQPYGNHNGGWTCFGPDGMLYVGTGDGGAGNDPQDNGQALDTHLGKILRIDVSSETGYQVPSDNPFLKTDGAKPEIWAYGLRNPWRCSFDRSTGDLWIGDVGQNHWEEINFMPNGRGAGANYGWRLREGLIQTPSKKAGGKSPKDTIDPVYVYPHGSGKTEGLSVTGGYVYRGKIKELQGRYVFADYQNPRIWSFRLKDGKAVDFKDHTSDLQPEDGRISLIPSFAEDHSGELFVIDFSGTIYRIVER